MDLKLNEIGKFIQTCRKEKELTQSELSERLSVSPQAVSNWERGESLPDVSLLPDLAGILGCSVDAILLAGESGIGCRRRVTVSQMREALEALRKMGYLLGQDHFIYQCVMEALDQRMNTTVEQAFADPHIFEVFVGEFLLGCVRNGDYVDPRDVQAHFKPGKARENILNTLREQGMR